MVTKYQFLSTILFYNTSFKLGSYVFLKQINLSQQCIQGVICHQQQCEYWNQIGLAHHACDLFSQLINSSISIITRYSTNFCYLVPSCFQFEHELALAASSVNHICDNTSGHTEFSLHIKAVTAIPKGSPYVVPSVEKLSTFPEIINLIG